MSVTSDIQQLYVAYFNRPADPIGLAYWTNVANANGGSTAAISAAFSTSPEYTATYAGLSPAEVVNAVYLNLFGRPAEPAGLTYWAPLIGNGKITIANVVTQIAAGAQGTDSAALQNKVTAATLFTNHLDTSPEILGYTGSAANNVGKAYVAGVTDAVSLLAATNSVDASISNAVAAHTAGTTGATVTLTTGLDKLTSAAGNAVFTANIVDNTNTFQSGDTLTATGAGNTLNADLGNSANFAILATTNGIQTVNITAEAQAYSTVVMAGTNNLTGLPVQINALRMGNVTNWGDVQSRADVVIENIQLPNSNVSSDVTNAVTFTMRDTQPGNINGVDGTNDNGSRVNAVSVGPSFRAYFDPQALKSANTSASSTVDVGLINSGPTYKSAAPLNTSNYTGFTLKVSTGGAAAAPANFQFSAADIAAIKASTLATNQAAVATAVNDAIDAYNLANNTKYTHTAGPVVPIFNSIDGSVEQIQTTTIGLAGSTVAVGSFNRALTNDQDPTAFIGNYMNPTPIPGSTALITSNIIVDNVGQGGSPQFYNYSGSTEGAGGDIIIGSMATSGGVQQFNIDVQRTSWNNSVQTTNNVLQVVNIVSDAVVVPAKYTTLTGGGQAYAIGAEIVPRSGDMIDYAMPGELVGTNGLRDVQTINATGFFGSLEIGETLDYAGFVRYLQGSNAIVPFSITLGDNTNGIVTPGHGTAYNSVNLAIDAAVVASGNFKETITGGAGDSVVNLSVLPQNGSGGLAGNNKWVDSTTSLQNVVVNVLSGNNTVKFNGAGAAQIHGGAGADAYYVDNTGGAGSNSFLGGPANLLKAVFVANAVANTNITTAVPTAIENSFGTPGAVGTASISFVNVSANTSTTNAFHTVEDVAVNGTNSGNVTTSNPAGDDLQGVQVLFNQAVSSPGITTTTIATDVLNAYKDYVANGGNPQGATVPTETTVATNGGGVITWETAAGAAVIVRAATDVMVETFTTSPGNTLQVTIGNEYVVSQTATQSAQGIVTLTRTTAGSTSFAYDGQTAAGNAPLTFTPAPGDAPSSNGTAFNGATPGNEVDTATFKPLQGFGASETIAGITVTDTQVGGATIYTAAQVAAAVMAGNGTYGSLVVTGEGAVTPPANTGYTPVNVYPAVGANSTVTTESGITVVNGTAAALTASQVAAAAAQGNVPGVTVTGALPASVVLNYDTLAATAANIPLVGTATAGVTASGLSTAVSIDTYGNFTTSVLQGGAPLKIFTGVGETVTVTYQGVSSTVTIPSTAAGTYTTTDVNNAIVTAVNNTNNNASDSTLSKLLHATQGSSNGSVILSSVIDGVHSAFAGQAPTIVFGHTGTGITTGTASGAYTAAIATSDSLALGQISSVQQARGDSSTINTSGFLVGGDSRFVNNSNITDTGSTGTSNVIDLSSNNAAVNALNNYTGGSANTVTLSGNGNSIVTNYKVANDTISTVVTHGVVVNAVNDAFQMSYFGTGATTNPGGLNINAFDLGLLTTAGVDVGSSFATANHVAGGGAGIVVLEVGNTTSVYYTTNVTNPTAANSTLEATLIGVAPAAALIHLV